MYSESLKVPLIRKFILKIIKHQKYKGTLETEYHSCVLVPIIVLRIQMVTTILNFNETGRYSPLLSRKYKIEMITTKLVQVPHNKEALYFGNHFQIMF